MEKNMPAPRGSEVWRDFASDGIPSSGLHEPKKPEIRSWSAWMESLVTSGVLSSGPWFATKEAMTLGYAANTIAVVYDDTTASENGLYIKVGSSGSGSWTQLTTFLPGYQFVTASPTEASTANAIVAVTSPRLPAGDGVALVSLAIPETNTASPVTVTFDGGSALTIKTNSGNDVAVGGLLAGMVVIGAVSGSTFRLVNDQISSAVVAAAEAAADRAEAAASVVVNLQSLGGDPTGVVDVSALLVDACNLYKHVIVPPGEFLIDTDIAIPAGTTVEFRQGGKLKVGTGVTLTWNGGIVAGPYQQIFIGDLVQSSYTTNSLTPYVLALSGKPKIEWSSPWWFGAVGDNITDDYDAFVCSFFFGPGSYVPGLDVASGQRYLCTTSIPVRRSMFIRGDGYSSWMRLVSFTPSGVGQFIGIAGLLPTVSGGEPAAFTDNVTIDGIHIDTNNGTNDNGIGGSMCRNVEVKRCFFSNVGRKAVTWQYHVHNNYVHDCIVLSASKEPSGTQSALSTEGENSSFTYANGVPGFDHDGADNTGNVFRDIHIYESGYSGITISNARRTTVENVTIDALGSLGRPVIVARVSKDNTFRGVKVRTSTRGFLIVTSATVVSTKFEDCWVQSCSGDNMFYSEGPGSEFVNCGGTQVDDATAWSIRGADCKIIKCRADFSAITSATQATALFSTASRFVMRGCYVNSANASRGFGGSTAVNIEIAENNFTGGVTDGVFVSGAYAKVNDNTIGGNASGRVRVGSGASGVNVSNNTLTGGASATVDWVNTGDLWASGSKYNNIGDVSTYHCLRFGARIDGSFAGSPEAVVTAAVGSTIRDTTGGNVYRKGSGSGNTGWVAM